jgi:hypothetical protein
MTTLALGLRQSSVGGSNVTPGDLPVLRRDMLQEDDFFVLLEDASKIVFTFGTADHLDLENNDFLLQEDSFKLQIQSN